MEDVVIDHIGCTSSGSMSRVSAIVDGSEVWFESADLPLRPSPEAFASSFLIAASFASRKLRVADPVCPIWYANTQNVLTKAADWWEYSSEAPVVSATAKTQESRKEVALCFSLGADSSYSLLRRHYAPQFLVFAHGFDVRLEDNTRAASCEFSLRGVAEARGAQAVIIRTNLLEHPLMKRAEWGHTHGGALAALGHLLSDHVGRLVISPTFPASSFKWGSHPELDRWWSSHSLAVENGCDSTTRGQRILAIASEPIVWQHLLVCYQNKTPTGNCSRCPKCVATMVSLLEAGYLEKTRVFDLSVPLARLIDEIPYLTSRMQCEFFAPFPQCGKLPPEICAASERLLRRSEEVLPTIEQLEILRKSNHQWELRCAHLEHQLNRMQNTRVPFAKRLLLKIKNSLAAL